MADKPATEKTEQPTARKLNKAREQGQTPQSPELMSAVSILVLLTMIASLAHGLMQWFIMQMRQGMSRSDAVFANSKTFINFFNAKIADSVLVMCPILAALCVGAIVTGVVISGFNFAPGAVRLKFSVANPITGLQKLINARSMVHLLTSIAKLFFVSIIVWLYLRDKLDMLATLRWAWSLQILAAIAKIILGLLIRVCIALLIIGVADAIYQKRKYIKDLKMTRQEVKEERKQTEGSPEVKRRVRQIQFETSLKRMLQEVPKANVVLVNPTHVAVALRYEAKTMEAPVMVAKGADHLAEKIQEIARAYGVPIVRKPELARTIYSTVELGGPIPETLYVAVAEVLALIYRLRHKK
ncbi:MAG: flagellar biosynthesis protein FlhB [Planctomycetota bacterium]|jgi:flagellar biosynthetic protein FlhB